MARSSADCGGNLPARAEKLLFGIEKRKKSFLSRVGGLHDLMAGITLKEFTFIQALFLIKSIPRNWTKETMLHSKGACCAHQKASLSTWFYLPLSGLHLCLKAQPVIWGSSGVPAAAVKAACSAAQQLWFSPDESLDDFFSQLDLWLYYCYRRKKGGKKKSHCLISLYNPFQFFFLIKFL